MGSWLGSLKVKLASYICVCPNMLVQCNAVMEKVVCVRVRPSFRAHPSLEWQSQLEEKKERDRGSASCAVCEEKRKEKQRRRERERKKQSLRKARKAKEMTCPARLGVRWRKKSK